MWAFTKSILRLARSIGRLGDILADIRDLYKLELEARFNIRQLDPTVKDNVEISYPNPFLARGMDDDPL